MRIRLRVDMPTGTSELEVDEAEVRLGRDPTCSLTFPDGSCQMVSWQHAKIELARGRAVLFDLGSTNGTYLNEARLKSPTAIRRGDRVRLGEDGPTLEVLDIDLRDNRKAPVERPNSAAPANQAPRKPSGAHPLRSTAPDHVGGPTPRQAGGRSSAEPIAVPTSDEPGGTRALLFEVHRQNRRLHLAVGILATFGLVALVAIFFAGRSPSDPEARAAIVNVEPGPTVGVEHPETENREPTGTTPNESVATAESRTTATPQPPVEPDWKAIVAANQAALVWIGVKTDQYEIPYFCGFVVGKNIVATTGFAVHYLSEQHRPADGFQVFVYRPARSGQYLVASEFRVHADYNPADHDSPQSIDNNLGVIFTVQDLEVAPCSIAPATDNMSRLRSGAHVATAGFDIDDETRKNDHDPAANEIEVSVHQGAVGRANPPGANRRELQIDAPAGMRGAPVFDRDGKVVAVMWAAGEASRSGIVASGLEALLQP